LTRPEAFAGRKHTTLEEPWRGERAGYDERRFIADPPKALPPPGWVRIETPEEEINRASVAELAFWLRLKATPGCLSRRNPDTGTMHLYVEPDSEAAVLFVSRMIKKLPPHQRHGKTAQLEQAERMLPTKMRRALPPKPVSKSAYQCCLPACPACGSGDFVHIRGKVHCAQCHGVLETCCD
jgi:hypothetical protein